ncbi:MAG: polyprenyl diphosphate synthase, partial [Bacilli bacterium]
MLSILSKWLKKKKLNLEEKTNKVKQGQLPHHVAIIMDGNGRWARAHGLPRVAGHRAGMKTVRDITQMANDIGIKIITMYAFSTENWKRPVDEVNYLMSLPDEFLLTELEDLIKNNVQVKMIGDENGLPHHTRSAMLKAVEQTKNNSGLILNFALNYGS